MKNSTSFKNYAITYLRKAAYFPLMFATSLGIIGGCDDAPEPEDNNPMDPTTFEKNSIILNGQSGGAGSEFGPGSQNPDWTDLEVEVQTPVRNPDVPETASPGVNVHVSAEGDENNDGTPEWRNDNAFYRENAEFDSTITASVTASQLRPGAEILDGTNVTLEFLLTTTNTETNEEFEKTVRVSAVYRAGATGARITGCSITNSNVSHAQSIYCNATNSEGNPIRWGEFYLERIEGLSDVQIGGSGRIFTNRELTDSDIGAFRYRLTVRDPITNNLSQPIDINGYIDKNRATARLGCQGSDEFFDIFMPETDLDELAVTCGSDMTQEEKPRAWNIRDVRCIVNTYNSWPADRRNTHVFYSDVTISNADSLCILDTAVAYYTPSPNLEGF